jgi:hypothetical protein
MHCEGNVKTIKRGTVIIPLLDMEDEGNVAHAFGRS